MVVTSQPAASTTMVSHPQNDYSGKAIVVLAFAIIGLICYSGTSLIFLACLVPALVLTIMVSWHLVKIDNLCIYLISVADFSVRLWSVLRIPVHPLMPTSVLG